MSKAKKKSEIKEVRTPIVTILGHVDHGKTTILDYIRSSNVQSKEVGGITQRISVFTIDHKMNGSDSTGKITFIDTPGHEAFDLMRTRGGSVADIVLLIVAADDGVMPQTEESIEIIKNSSAKPIVVINKVDLPNTDIEKIKRDLSNKGIQVEEYGGKTPLVKVSGKTGEGITDLLDTINLVIEIEGFIPREKLTEGVEGGAFVLESVKDKSKGYVSSIVVTEGSFKKGSWFAYKSGNEVVVERIKGFVNENNQPVDLMEAGQGGKIIGLSKLLDLGSKVFTMLSKDEKLAGNVLAAPIVETQEGSTELATAVGAETDWFNQLFNGEEKKEEIPTLNVILKSSSEGSLEALKKSLVDLEIEGYKVKIVESGVGEITLRDVEMAEVTKSIMLGFEVSVDGRAQAEAEKKRVFIRTYDLIYKLIEEVTDALTMLATPKESEEELGSAEIKAIFTLSDGSKVLGGKVKSGILKRGERCYIVRGDDIVSEGKIVSLRQNKNTINEAPKNADFGAVIEPTPEAIEGDTIYCFKIVK